MTVQTFINNYEQQRIEQLLTLNRQMTENGLLSAGRKIIGMAADSASEAGRNIKVGFKAGRMSPRGKIAGKGSSKLLRASGRVGQLSTKGAGVAGGAAQGIAKGAKRLARKVGKALDSKTHPNRAMIAGTAGLAGVGAGTYGAYKATSGFRKKKKK